MVGRDGERELLSAFVTADTGRALVLRGRPGSARAPCSTTRRASRRPTGTR
ncbi:hypothetical protein ACFQY7_36695 [Actinomadura luteofluorescens]|uniref:hypothetical protein n=1 Tax=Actinomadura luteofluorescens TaxID=46163 RepID=UPI003644FAF4